jgi:uncharacterized iron-regulated protein
VFHRAVAAYSVHELRARFDADALAAAIDNAQSSGLFLLGEQHKQAETPRAIYTLMRRLDLWSLALEWESDLRPVVDAYLAERSDATEALSEDGRITEGHFAVLGRLHAEGRLERLILMDETSRDWTGDWTERDAGMARTLLRERDPGQPMLVVAGAFHTTLDGQPTLATLIDMELPGVPRGLLEYAEVPRREGHFRRDRNGDFIFALPAGVPIQP